MAVQIKCFVCNGVILDDRECRVCEGKGQIESLLKLSMEDLKNSAKSSLLNPSEGMNSWG